MIDKVFCQIMKVKDRIFLESFNLSLNTVVPRVILVTFQCFGEPCWYRYYLADKANILPLFFETCASLGFSKLYFFVNICVVIVRELSVQKKFSEKFL